MNLDLSSLSTSVPEAPYYVVYAFTEGFVQMT